MFHFETPHDIVLATGRQITVRNFVKMCLSYAEEEVEWQGKGIEERGITKKYCKVYNGYRVRISVFMSKVDCL